VLGLPTVQAQRIISELETNSDKTMDSRPDSLGKKENKIVPNDVKAWNIDETYGNITPTYVDTLHHLYQNNDLPEGITGHYNSLGNVGSPRMSRIFMERPQMSNFLFTDPFDMFFVPTEKFRFYNTKSPFMNIAYNWCGTKTTGSDHVKAVYTNNAGKRTNIGALFDYIYGQGYYDNQSTSFMNASAWASHLGDKYNFHFYYTHNFMKMRENGGIEDEGYITNPESMPTNYGSADIPTNLTNTWNRQEHDVLYFNHHYNIGFYRTELVDSTTTRDVFVPVSKIFHTVKLQNMMRNYRAYTQPNDYHSEIYLPNDTTQDRTKNFNVKTLLGLSLCEGFNKWAVFGINAYVGYDYNRYSMVDIGEVPLGLDIYNRKYHESNILVGGQIIRSQGTAVHYHIDGEFVAAGDNIGQFNVNGHGELNLPVFGDTAQVAINAYIKNTVPSFYFRHYHAKNAWWDNDFSKEFRQRVEGVITIPHTGTKLTGGVENIKNYSYFMNNGSTYTSEDGKTTTITNNIAPAQCSDNIQVVSLNLDQKLTFGIFHFDNDITYQTCTKKEVLPLPTLSTFTNLYIRFKIAQVLKTELGGTMTYFTEYYAPDYSPVLGQFMTQNASKRKKIGNYPIISAYANFDLKRTRFYVQYYHANQNDGRYFWAPCYPINPSGIHFGLSWNFYD